MAPSGLDYQGLNLITVKKSPPLPLTNTAHDTLAGVSYFTKLDLYSAYNLVPIWKGNKRKTAFISPTGHYESLVMPSVEQSCGFSTPHQRFAYLTCISMFNMSGPSSRG